MTMQHRAAVVALRMLRLARRSSWAGHRADQPLPAFLASGSFDRSLSVGLIAFTPFRRLGLLAQPGLQIGRGVQDGSPLTASDT